MTDHDYAFLTGQPAATEGPAAACRDDRIHLRPYQLTLLTTRNCVARCAHCLMWSAPRLKDKLTYAQMARAIEDLHESFTLSVVIFAGGEPMLLGEELLDTIAFADSLGICTRLVTSANYMSTPARAKEKIIELREAGLSELNISADDYHLPYVPFERVVHAWHAAKGMGFRSVVVANSSAPGNTVTPEYIAREIGDEVPVIYDDDGTLKPMPAPAPDGTVYAISNSRTHALGRALHELPADHFVYPESQEALMTPCPWAVRSPALSPRGHMTSCCGIDTENNRLLDFGPVDDREGARSVDRIKKANSDVVLSAIATEGPGWLMQFLKRHAPQISFRDRYTSVCEICEHITTREACVSALNELRTELMIDLTISKMKRAAALRDEVRKPPCD